METQGRRVCRQCWLRWVVGETALGPDDPERDPVTSPLATDPRWTRALCQGPEQQGTPTARLCPFLSASRSGKP